MLNLRDEEEFNPYVHFKPKVWVSVIGTVAFSVVTLGQLFCFFRGRAWFFWAMIIGALMEAAGYVARTISVKNLTEDGVIFFVIYYIALILAPTFIAAACYVTFGRIVWFVCPPEKRNFRTLWCPPRFISLIFVGFDLLTFFIQLLGSSAMSAGMIKDKNKHETEEDQKKKKDAQDTGLKILRFGLILQLVCFALFVFIGVRFLIVSRKWTNKAARYSASNPNWKRLNWTVNISALVIMLRAIYRLLEFNGDKNNYFLRYEWPFWAFDSVPMFGIFVAFIFVHPGQYLPSRYLGVRLRKGRLQKEEACTPPEFSQTQAFNTQNFGHF